MIDIRFSKYFYYYLDLVFFNISEKKKKLGIKDVLPIFFLLFVFKNRTRAHVF